jgi:hypothetical protein
MAPEKERRAEGPFSRRALLVGGTGAIAAIAAQALGRVSVADATNGDPVIAGEITSASGTTEVSSTAGIGLVGATLAKNQVGVEGFDGGPVGSGIGVLAQSSNNIGLFATASSYAIKALGGNASTPAALIENQSAGVAVLAESTTGTALRGTTISDGKPAISGENGGGASGVLGTSASGYGVHGTTTSDTRAAVMGDNAGMGAGVTGSGPGRGVHGLSSTGVGVLADGAIALQVNGPAMFERSGLATVPKGSTSVKVKNVALTSASLILATVQSRGASYVKQVIPDPGASSFVIYVNKVTDKTSVAWFVVN